MKPRSVLAIATLLAAPLLGCGRQKELPRFSPPPITSEEPERELTIIPFFMPHNLQNLEDKDEFFLLRRDKEKGFIYLTSEKSTQGIINHLVRYHGHDPEEAMEAVSNVDFITLQFNKEARAKQQIEINFKDLPKGKHPPKVNWASLTDEELSKLLSECDILTPQLKDCLDTPEKVFEFETCDGIVSNLSVLSHLGIMSKHGAPSRISLQKGMDIVPGSIEQKWYVDPKTHRLRMGIALKITEQKGRFGLGGENYLILPFPRVVITTDTRMYLIGFDMDVDGEVKEETFDENNQVPDRVLKEPDFKKEETRFGRVQMI